MKISQPNLATILFVLWHVAAVLIISFLYFSDGFKIELVFGWSLFTSIFAVGWFLFFKKGSAKTFMRGLIIVSLEFLLILIFALGDFGAQFG